MSQAKVDKYKKEKANRKKEMAKQKTEKIIGIICGCAILVAGTDVLYQYFCSIQLREWIKHRGTIRSAYQIFACGASPIG